MQCARRSKPAVSVNKPGTGYCSIDSGFGVAASMLEGVRLIGVSERLEHWRR